jgi:hypothetical protein
MWISRRAAGSVSGSEPGPPSDHEAVVVEYTTTMSKRLQVVVDDAELHRYQRAAGRSGLTLAEWVRQALRSAERTTAVGDPDRKLGAIRRATAHEFPAPDIEQMLAEIEHGYRLNST